MFKVNIPLERKLRYGDFLRSVGYIGLALWAVLYVLHPSPIVEYSVQPWVQTLWLGVAFVGAIMAALGCVLKIDIKLELPGILFMLVGPLLYFVTNIYLLAAPGTQDDTRIASLLPLVVYAVLPVLFILPRVFDLYTDVLTSRARQTEPGRPK